MLQQRWYARAFWACGVLFLAGLAQAQTPPKDAVEAEARIRSLLNAKLDFKHYVFSEEKFPPCDFEQPERVQELLGPFTIKTTFYDRAFQATESARDAGPYGAVVEVVPRKGSVLRRYFTLYRTADKIDPGQRFKPEALEDLAKRLGLEAAVVKQEQSLLTLELKERAFEELARDPRAARLFAGLSQTKAGTGPARKNANAFALDRQWWVELKRKRSGLDKVFAKPFVCPRPLEGKPASVVRAGTAADAGMQPDAAEKVDAICKEWAADDDQAFAVCIVRHGVIVLHQAYGQRDGQPMTLRTKSWMASITKTMSASLMMMLVDQGLVDLDDPVEKFIPELRGQKAEHAISARDLFTKGKGGSGAAIARALTAKPLVFLAQLRLANLDMPLGSLFPPLRDLKVETPLRIRHLYTHTNGLHLWPGWNDELPDVEERVSAYYPLLKVDQAWAYNGVGYTLGGKVIENVSGEAVPLFFRKHLLDPLACPDTDVIGTHADALSVPLDIARFGQLLLNRGAYGNQRFFREETFQKMLPEKMMPRVGPDTTRIFGIGLDGRPERFGHGAASAATFSIDRTDDLVIVMTRNRYGKNQGKYGGKFMEAIRKGMVK